MALGGVKLSGLARCWTLQLGVAVLIFADFYIAAGAGNDGVSGHREFLGKSGGGKSETKREREADSVEFSHQGHFAHVPTDTGVLA